MESRANAKNIDIILATKKDWSKWNRAFVQKVKSEEVWEYVDPTSTKEPLKLPELPGPSRNFQLTGEALDRIKGARANRKTKATTRSASTFTIISSPARYLSDHSKEGQKNPLEKI